MAVKLTTLSAFIAAAIALATASPAQAVDNTPLPAPTPLSPAAGAVVDSVPPFAWSPVSVADHYEFQVAADAGFNSPVLGRGSDDFTTQNARATLLKTIPNGTYYWRVRAVGANGSVSAWTAGRSFRKSWTAAAALQSPAGGAGVECGWSDVDRRVWNRCAEARLVGGARGGQLSRLGRDRPVIGLARLPHDGRPNRDSQGAGELARDLPGAGNRYLLLGRDPR